MFISIHGICQTFTLTDSIFEVGSTYKINDLRIGFDGDRLHDDSKQILDSIATFLKNNLAIQVEFGSYNDLRGNAVANLKVSQERAEWFVNYLISKGVNKEQMIAIGYGESEPVISEEEINKYRTTDKKEYERLHQLNRRNILTITNIGCSK